MIDMILSYSIDMILSYSIDMILSYSIDMILSYSILLFETVYFQPALYVHQTRLSFTKNHAKYSVYIM